MSDTEPTTPTSQPPKDDTPFFLKSGNSTRVSPLGALTITPELPIGTYTVRQNPNTGEFYLDDVEALTVPSEIFGANPQMRVDRIFKSFHDRPGKGTGVLLSGEKGSGKTLLCKMLARTAMENNMPVILVETGFAGPSFSSFLTSLGRPCMVFWDEFDKLYPEHKQQQGLLSLLDGTSVVRHLFVLTANVGVTYYMKNRPGRVYYLYEYGALERDVIVEYVTKKLVHPNRVSEVIDTIGRFPDVNFDMMQAIVEESNRFDEPATEVVRHINVRLVSKDDRFTISVKRNGVQLTKAAVREREIRVDPFSTSLKYRISIGTLQMLALTYASEVDTTKPGSMTRLRTARGRQLGSSGTMAILSKISDLLNSGSVDSMQMIDDPQEWTAQMRAIYEPRQQNHSVPIQWNAIQALLLRMSTPDRMTLAASYSGNTYITICPEHLKTIGEGTFTFETSMAGDSDGDGADEAVYEVTLERVKLPASFGDGSFFRPHYVSGEYIDG